MTASWHRGVLTLQCGEGLAERSGNSVEMGWQSVLLLICLVTGDGSAETNGKSCQSGSKGAALAAAP